MKIIFCLLQWALIAAFCASAYGSEESSNPTTLMNNDKNQNIKSQAHLFGITNDERMPFIGLSDEGSSTELIYFFLLMANTAGAIFFLRHRTRKVAKKLNKAQGQLMSKQKDLNLLLDSIPIGVVKIDSNHQISFINRQAFGFFSNEFREVGKTDFLALSEEHMNSFKSHEILRKKVKEIVTHNKSAEYRLKKVDRVVDVSHFPMANGEALIVYNDVTQKVFDKEARYLVKEEAEFLANEKANFVSNLGCEIHHPLVGLKDVLEKVKRTELSLEQRQYVSDAHYKAISLLLSIDDHIDSLMWEA